MTTMHHSLRQRLINFQIDDPTSSFCFSDRLAKEQGWSAAYARRVVEEYKRFLFLAMTAGHVVTPSDQVDQAWHQHLTYTESYWRELCGEVLGKPLHHGPTKGGQEETAKYRDLYENTLASYRAAFGEAPPADVWPATDVRFGSDLACRRVNTSQNWVVPKPSQWVKRICRPRRQETIALGLVPIALAVWHPFNLRGPDFLVVFAITYFCSVAAAFILRSQMRREFGERSNQFEETISDPYEAAYLAGGERRVAQAATGNLVQHGIFEVEKSTRRLITNLPLPGNAHEVERAVHAAVTATGGKAEGKLFDSFASTGLNQIRGRLGVHGFIETSSSYSAARWWSLAAMTPVLILGAVKLSLGISRDRPVEILVVGLIVTLATMAGFAWHRPRCTAAGKRMLSDLTNELRTSDRKKTFPTDGSLSTDLAFNIGVLGLGAAVAPSDPLANLYSPTGSGWTSGCATTGCSSSSGGGGGGCGGGGCGGCGS